MGWPFLCMTLIELHNYDSGKKGGSFYLNTRIIERLYHIHTSDERVKHTRIFVTGSNTPIEVFESIVDIVRILS